MRTHTETSGCPVRIPHKGSIGAGISKVRNQIGYNQGGDNSQERHRLGKDFIGKEDLIANSCKIALVPATSE